MKSTETPPTTIDEYIKKSPTKVQSILLRIRATVRKSAPTSTEKVSYRMPAFFENGVLIYFGAFKTHIGIYPPVRDVELQQECKKYAGEKGNLRLPLDQPIPYPLIAKIVKARRKENEAKLLAKKIKPTKKPVGRVSRPVKLKKNPTKP